MTDSFIQFEETSDWQDLGKGVQRKVAVFDDTLMLVKVRFQTGAIGELHQHVHTQISYVSAGKFKYTIGAETHIIKTGDSCLIPSNIVHGCECLEEGELIDSFTPHRADFLD